MFLATPVSRTVERIELPSTRHLTTAVRRAGVSLFILTIIHELSDGKAAVLSEWRPPIAWAGGRKLDGLAAAG